jgi:hypothetical protein
MKITNPETGATHDEPICRECSGLLAMPNPLCPGFHGPKDRHDAMRRICAAVGHIQGGSFCLRCKGPNAPFP